MEKKIRLDSKKIILFLNMSSFNKYSKYYDLLYDDKNYDLESEYVYNHIKKKSSPKSILELGCGSGGHAPFFQRKVLKLLV